MDRRKSLVKAQTKNLCNCSLPLQINSYNKNMNKSNIDVKFKTLLN